MPQLLTITSVVDASSGGGRHVLSLLTGLRRDGRDVAAILFQEGSLADRLRQAGVAVHVCRIRGQFDWVGAACLRSLVKELRPSLVHTHGERAAFAGNWVAKSLRVPNIVSTIHRSIPRTVSWRAPQRRLYTWLEDLSLRRATTAIIAVSEAMRAELVRRGHDAHKITVIYHGVQSPSWDGVMRSKRDALELRARLELSQDAFVVGSVGRLTKEKGYQQLVVAMARVRCEVPTSVLVLVGDGPERTALEGQCRASGVADAVRFVGRQSPVDPWLASFDAFVLPTQWDSFGLALVEAMGLGIPVIATDAGGPAEIVEHGVSGLLVPPGDAEALAGAILYLREHRDLAQRMGACGRKVVCTRFTEDEMVSRTGALFAELLQLRWRGSGTKELAR